MTGRNLEKPPTGQSRWQQLADIYADSPPVRGLIALAANVAGSIPLLGGAFSALDAVLTKQWENMREQDAAAFFDELDRGSIHLTPGVIRQNEFLRGYFATLAAAGRAHKREKIRLFARLLVNGVAQDRLGEDLFDEYISILEDLSVRELRILMILKQLEDTHPHQMVKREGVEPELENDLQRATRYWKSLEVEVETAANVRASELSAILNRLARTGLYETFAGSYFDYSGGKGHTTSLFEDFAQWLDLEAARSGSQHTFEDGAEASEK